MNSNQQQSGTPEEKEKDKRAEGYLLEAFRGHSNLLRNWFVAYGVGAPALFLSEGSVWKVLKKDPDTLCILGMFVAVLLLQGLLSAFNKTMDYRMFSAKFYEKKEDYEKTRSYNFAACWMENWWIEFVVDAISIVLLVVATLWAAILLTP